MMRRNLVLDFEVHRWQLRFLLEAYNTMLHMYISFLSQIVSPNNTTTRLDHLHFINARLRGSFRFD